MAEIDRSRANAESRQAWNRNATFWDERMGEGNDFVEVLIWPTAEKLLALQPGERVLDVACGNGLTSRRMAALGAEVVAIDFSERMIAHARQRTVGPRSSMPQMAMPSWLYGRTPLTSPCAIWRCSTWRTLPL
jgi:2-polyprenyl-3-methyl-5-hydroxy-6-metoxy-1,4-benzoquinol methylase